MSEKYKIDPCNEDWDAMSPREGGRFCQRCEHVVVDATGMTKSEFRAFFEKAGGDVCAQVVANPVGAPIFRRDAPRPRALGSFVLLSSLMASIPGCTDAAPVPAPVEIPMTTPLPTKNPPSAPASVPAVSAPAPASPASPTSTTPAVSPPSPEAVSPPRRQHVRGRMQRIPFTR